MIWSFLLNSIFAVRTYKKSTDWKCLVYLVQGIWALRCVTARIRVLAWLYFNWCSWNDVYLDLTPIEMDNNHVIYLSLFNKQCLLTLFIEQGSYIWYYRQLCRTVDYHSMMAVSDCELQKQCVFKTFSRLIIKMSNIHWNDKASSSVFHPIQCIQSIETDGLLITRFD